ncbi:MAG: GMC family oxidoreductase, partial [Candidatus Competibacteraceae bacterium]|nr:GMC family oxidoreductase [Candidatus Competibacteraceae bacterium]
MAVFEHTDNSVVVIVGSGAGGGTLANELCQQGIKVVLLEAGSRLGPDKFHNDEWEAFLQTAWLDMRMTSGSWRVARDFPNLPAWICKTVGGSTVHWAGASLRLQEHEFKAQTAYGDIDGANMLDWPLTLQDLEPYYSKAEDKMGVTRTNDIPGLPGNNNFKVMYAGATRLGYKNVHTGRMAINSRPRDDRGSCLQLGFCFQGCKSGAKWSTLYTEIPKAEATGNLELRTDCHVAQIEHDDSGKVTGVVYFDKDGVEQRQQARLVCVAGNSIETPRLLLNSASSQYPDGLANSSGQVGKNYMRHMTGSIYAVFDKPVHMYRGTTMAGIITDESGHDTSRGFAGGYEMETLSLGLPFITSFLDPGSWGREFTQYIDLYENMAGMWLVGEDLPQESNRITLHDTAKDKFGLPVPNVHFDDHPNDIAMRNHAFKQGSAVYHAAGAIKAIETPPYPSTHNLGTCRMSEKPEDGVCNAFGQTHDIAN